MKGSSIGFAGAASLAVILGACDNSPARPSALRRVPSPVPTPVTFTLGGRVTEPVDVPVESATVTVVAGESSGKSAVTTSTGAYFLSGVQGALSVQVSKEGYMSETRQVTMDQTRTLDVEIMPLVAHTSIEGSWRITFEASQQCLDLPAAAKVRRYRAAISQQGARIEVELSEAKFEEAVHLSGTIRGTEFSLSLGDFYYGYYDRLPLVIEKLGENRFLYLTGLVRATGNRSSMTGTLAGEFAVISSPSRPFRYLALCGDPNHRVTLSRQ